LKGFRRSIDLFRAFRHERTDPASFYTLLADDTVADVGRFCQLKGAVVLDVGGASGYVADAFRSHGARALTAEYDFDQATEHGRTLTKGVIADGCALPIATGSVEVGYSSNVLEHVITPERMLSEMVRVMAPGGVVYVTFTNWLSPCRYERTKGEPVKNRYGVSLFKLSVGDVLKWCRSCPDVEVLDTFPRYYPRWTKWLVRVPGLREIVTWNLVVVMRRKALALSAT
jgi:SAM-dependent methyltransferase